MRLEKLKSLLGIASKPSKEEEPKEEVERKKKWGECRNRCCASCPGSLLQETVGTGCHDFRCEVTRSGRRRRINEWIQRDDGSVCDSHRRAHNSGSGCAEGRSKRVWTEDHAQLRSEGEQRAQQGGGGSGGDDGSSGSPARDPGRGERAHPAGWHGGGWRRTIPTLWPRGWKFQLNLVLGGIILWNAGLGDRIEAALRDIAQEEAELSNEGLGFTVYRTRYGQLYHSSLTCCHLQGARVSLPREFKWCQPCRGVALQTRGIPIPGSPLYLSVSGEAAHTDERCPWINNMKQPPFCLTCREREGVVWAKIEWP